MYLKAGKTFGIELEADLVPDKFYESRLVFDNLQHIIRRSDLLPKRLVSDDDDSNVRIFRSPVREEVLIVGLQAVKGGFDGISRRVGQ